MASIVVAGVALTKNTVEDTVEETVEEVEGEGMEVMVAPVEGEGMEVMVAPKAALDKVGGWVRVRVGWEEGVRVGGLPVPEGLRGEAEPVAGRVGVRMPLEVTLGEEEREGEAVSVGRVVGVPTPIEKEGEPEFVGAPVGVLAATEAVGEVLGETRAVRVAVTESSGAGGAPWDGVSEGEATMAAEATDTNFRVLRLVRDIPVGKRLQSAATAVTVLA